MVIRIKTGKKVAGAIRYNEQKVTKGEAEQLAALGFASTRQAFTSLFYKTKTLEARAQKNARVQKPALHASLSFHPSERPSDAHLVNIVHEFMDGIGYGRQPYLVYRHDDTAHPHVHVVSVAIDENGKKISDSFLNERCNKVRQRLESQYGLVVAQGRGKKEETGLEEATALETKPKQTKVTLEEKINLVLAQESITTFSEFEANLAKNNIKVRKHEVAGRVPGLLFQRSNGRKAITPAINASRLSVGKRGKPTYGNLEAAFRERAGDNRKLKAEVADAATWSGVEEVSLAELVVGQGRGGDAFLTEEFAPQYQKRMLKGGKKRRGHRLGHNPERGPEL